MCIWCFFESNILLIWYDWKDCNYFDIKSLLNKFFTCIQNISRTLDILNKKNFGIRLNLTFHGQYSLSWTDSIRLCKTISGYSPLENFSFGNLKFFKEKHPNIRCWLGAQIDYLIKINSWQSYFILDHKFDPLNKTLNILRTHQNIIYIKHRTTKTRIIFINTRLTQYFLYNLMFFAIIFLLILNCHFI